MKLTLLGVTAFAAFTSAAIANIRGSPTKNCSGAQQWICMNIPSARCCAFPVNIYSILWNLPAKGGGIAYNGEKCNGANYPFVRGANTCAGYQAKGYPVRSAAWVAEKFPLQGVEAQSQLELRHSKDNCDPASVFVFTHNGETTVLNVPEGSVGQVVDLAAKDDYEGLKALWKDWQSELNTPPTEIEYFSTMDD